MRTRLMQTVVAGFLGGATSFFTLRNEERKQYEHAMKEKGYTLFRKDEKRTLAQEAGTVTGGGHSSPEYVWKKQTSSGEDTKPYDSSNRLGL